VRRFDELVGAVTLLTRVPVARLLGDRAWPDAVASVWAYPVVGVLVGGAGAVALWLAGRLAMPPGIGAILAIAATILLTGGLHEDGLADTADGLGGGGTVARKLEIMRDSRIGSYGTLALIVALAVRGTALASLPPATGVAALVAAGGLGRGAIVLTLLLLPPVRTDGLTASLRRLKSGVAITGLGLAAVTPVLLPAPVALGGIAGATAAAFAVAALARWQIGGATGDVLGAAEVVAECAVLCAVASIAS